MWAQQAAGLLRPPSGTHLGFSPFLLFLLVLCVGPGRPTCVGRLGPLNFASPLKMAKPAELYRSVGSRPYSDITLGYPR